MDATYYIAELNKILLQKRQELELAKKEETTRYQRILLAYHTAKTQGSNAIEIYGLPYITLLEEKIYYEALVEKIGESIRELQIEIKGIRASIQANYITFHLP
jgi:hypothetical protein